MDRPYIRDTAAAIISVSGRTSNVPICDQDQDSNESEHRAMQITMQSPDNNNPLQITVTRGNTPNMFQTNVPQNVTGYMPVYTQPMQLTTPEYYGQPQQYNELQYMPTYAHPRPASPDYYRQPRQLATPNFYRQSASPNVMTISVQPQENASGSAQIYRMPLKDASPQITTFYKQSPQITAPNVIQIAVQPNTNKPDFISMPPQSAYTRTKEMEISIEPANTAREAAYQQPGKHAVGLSLEPNNASSELMQQNTMPKVVQISVSPTDISFNLETINGQQSQTTAPSAVQISVQPNASNESVPIQTALPAEYTEQMPLSPQDTTLESVTVNGQPVQTNGQNPVQIHVQPTATTPAVVKFSVKSPDATAGSRLELVVQQNSAKPDIVNITAQPSHVTNQMSTTQIRIPQIENIVMTPHYDKAKNSLQLGLQISVPASPDVAYVNIEYPCSVAPRTYEINLNPPSARQDTMAVNMQADASTSLQTARAVCITMQPLWDNTAGMWQLPSAILTVGKPQTISQDNKFARPPMDRNWIQPNDAGGSTTEKGIGSKPPAKRNVPATRPTSARTGKMGHITENDWENENVLNENGWVKYWNTETKQFLH